MTKKKWRRRKKKNRKKISQLLNIFSIDFDLYISAWRYFHFDSVHSFPYLLSSALVRLAKISSTEPAHTPAGSGKWVLLVTYAKCENISPKRTRVYRQYRTLTLQHTRMKLGSFMPPFNILVLTVRFSPLSPLCSKFTHNSFINTREIEFKSTVGSCVKDEKFSYRLLTLNCVLASLSFVYKFLVLYARHSRWHEVDWGKNLAPRKSFPMISSCASSTAASSSSSRKFKKAKMDFLSLRFDRRRD